MTANINTPAVAVSASTTSAQGTLPVGSEMFIRVVNGSSSIAYVDAGAAPTATAANIAIAPNSTAYLQRNPNTDLVVAVLLATGTGIVSFSLTGTPND